MFKSLLSMTLIATMSLRNPLSKTQRIISLYILQQANQIAIDLRLYQARLKYVTTQKPTMYITLKKLLAARALKNCSN